MSEHRTPEVYEAVERKMDAYYAEDIDHLTPREQTEVVKMVIAELLEELHTNGFNEGATR